MNQGRLFWYLYVNESKTYKQNGFCKFADFVHISEAYFKNQETDGLVLLFAVVVKIKNL